MRQLWIEECGRRYLQPESYVAQANQAQALIGRFHHQLQVLDASALDFE